MAQQKGIFKVKGTVGDVSFYRTRDGYLLREKSSLDGKRIASDPAFVRTRENSAEFSRAAQSGKLVRHAFRHLIKDASDSKVVSRLTKEMMLCLFMDDVHARGERTVTENIMMLKYFDFNFNAKLRSTFYVPFVAAADPATSEMGVHIEAYTPTSSIVAPVGTTHYQLHAAGAALDFEAKTFESQFMDSPVLPYERSLQPAGSLSVTVTPGSSLPMILVFGISFSQEVNGEQYPLKNNAYNALSIVAVG